MRNPVLVSVAAALLVFVGFVCAFLLVFPPERTAPTYQGGRPVAFDPDLGFAARRNSSVVRVEREGTRHHLHYDARGARVNRSGDQTPERVGVLTVGCSFSWGAGLENDFTYTERIGGRLGVPVANFAYGSYSTVQALQMMERHAGLAPKVVIYGFMADHLGRNVRSCAPAYGSLCLPVSFFDPDRGAIRLPPDAEEVFATYVRYSEEVLSSERPLVPGDFAWPFHAAAQNLKIRRPFQAAAVDSAAMAEALALLLRRMADRARQVDAELVVVSLPYGPDVSTAPPHGSLLSAMERIRSPRVHFVDMARHLGGVPADSLALIPGVDPHPSAYYHARVGEVVADLIRRNGWLDLTSGE